jgi:hypothetical protein
LDQSSKNQVLAFHRALQGQSDAASAIKEQGGGGAVALPSAKDRWNTSSFPGSIARLTCLAMVRSEENFISAG